MNRLPWMVAAAMAALLVGCASGGSQVVPKPPAEVAAAGDGSVMALTALRLENEPEVRLVVETSGRPAYTGYHPQPDVYVVDLMKTVKQPGLVLPTNLPEGIASIAATDVLELGKPLTRITVRFREPAQAFASAAGNGVVVGFELAEGEPAPMVASAEAEVEAEPLVEEPAVDVETISATAPAPVATAALEEAPAEKP
ncbi:MAG: hypothetical protein ACRD2J_18000, partial [Thermoanaerobaculia bacterium]